MPKIRDFNVDFWKIFGEGIAPDSQNGEGLRRPSPHPIPRGAPKLSSA